MLSLAMAGLILVGPFARTVLAEKCIDCTSQEVAVQIAQLRLDMAQKAYLLTLDAVTAAGAALIKAAADLEHARYDTKWAIFWLGVAIGSGSIVAVGAAEAYLADCLLTEAQMAAALQAAHNALHAAEAARDAAFAVVIAAQNALMAAQAALAACEAAKAAQECCTP
jgi:hypothetical protein